MADVSSEQTNKESYVFLYLILGMIGLLTPFAIDMYLPAMPDIANDFKVKDGAVQATLAAYTLGFAIGQLIYGPLSDSYGRRPILIWGIVLFTIASLLCGFSASIDQLLYIRFVQGFVGAGAAVVVQAVVRDMFNKEEFARAMSFITLVITISPLLAPFFGGHIATLWGWRNIFIVLAILSFLVLMAVFWRIPETLSPENKQPLRLLGTLRNYVRLMINPVAMGLILSGAFSFAGLFAFITAGSFVYINIFGVQPEHFGYFFALNVIGMVVMSLFNGRAVRKMGSHWMIRFGLTVQMIAGCALLACWLFDLGLWFVVFSVVLFVGNISVIGSNSMGLLLNNYPQIAGTASSLTGTLRFGVAALISSVITLFPEGVVWPMIVTMFCCALLSTSLYWFLSRNA